MNFLHSILHWPNAHFNLKKALLLLLALLSNQKWRWVTMKTTWNQRIVLNNLRSYLERNQFSNGAKIRPTTYVVKLPFLECASLLWKETLHNFYFLVFRNVMTYVKLNAMNDFTFTGFIYFPFQNAFSKKPFRKLMQRMPIIFLFEKVLIFPIYHPNSTWKP